MTLQARFGRPCTDIGVVIQRIQVLRFKVLCVVCATGGMEAIMIVEFCWIAIGAKGGWSFAGMTCARLGVWRPRGPFPACFGIPFRRSSIA